MFHIIAFLALALHNPTMFSEKHERMFRFLYPDTATIYEIKEVGFLKNREKLDLVLSTEITLINEEKSENPEHGITPSYEEPTKIPKPTIILPTQPLDEPEPTRVVPTKHIPPPFQPTPTELPINTPTPTIPSVTITPIQELPLPIISPCPNWRMNQADSTDKENIYCLD
jgi:hypothetical protein